MPKMNSIPADRPTLSTPTQVKRSSASALTVTWNRYCIVHNGLFVTVVVGNISKNESESNCLHLSRSEKPAKHSKLCRVVWYLDLSASDCHWPITVNRLCQLIGSSEGLGCDQEMTQDITLARLASHPSPVRRLE